MQVGSLWRLDSLYLEQRGCQRRNSGRGQFEREEPAWEQHAETSVPIGEPNVVWCAPRARTSGTRLCAAVIDTPHVGEYCLS